MKQILIDDINEISAKVKNNFSRKPQSFRSRHDWTSKFSGMRTITDVRRYLPFCRLSQLRNRIPSPMPNTCAKKLFFIPYFFIFSPFLLPLLFSYLKCFNTIHSADPVNQESKVIFKKTNNKFDRKFPGNGMILNSKKGNY